ncbi:TRAP transporter small permease [Egicoccus sp. AB-alg2]|uniref:TRAP transporter small permease n=1 Tax=Egicoccus sp. AB-alg2 TaxID=3242693 RepID=UPI00359D46BA
MHVLHIVNDALAAVVRLITGVFTALLVVIVTSNVFARYVLRVGLPWVEELSRILFVWVVFLGACVALQERGHLAITFVVDRLPPRGRKLLVWVTNALTAAFLVAIGLAGWQLVTSTLDFGTRTPAMRVSLAWGFASVPVAAVIMLVTLVTQTLDGSDEQPRGPGHEPSEQVT